MFKFFQRDVKFNFEDYWGYLLIEFIRYFIELSLFIKRRKGNQKNVDEIENKTQVR